MTIAASVILDEAAGLLLDATYRTWPAADLLTYLNEALRATAFVKPDMYTVQGFVAMAVGVLQELPEDGVALIDVVRNQNGRVITQVDKGLLEEANRFWPAATRETTLEHYTADPRNPRRFQVFPPSNGTSLVELLYGAVPPTIVSAAEEIPVPDSYQTVLLNFILAKAYAKNSKRQDLVKSNMFMQQWGSLLGLKSGAQLAVSPKVAAQPGVTT